MGVEEQRGRKRRGGEKLVEVGGIRVQLEKGNQLRGDLFSRSSFGGD
jgi:hypothetical protein